MPTLRYKDRALTPAAGETVLECLLREGIPVPSSCRAGSCQSCLVRATAGVPPPEAQQGLKDTLRTRNFFLACVARPSTDLSVSLSDADELRCDASVDSSSWLSPDILRLRLRPKEEFPYYAGQFINLIRPDGLTRSYSLASVPGRDPFLELHIRIFQDGQMGGFVRSLAAADQVALRGPAGECFYVAGRPDQPILLAGTGTGLAPLYGLLQDALRRGHRGPLVVAHGAVTAQGLYLVDELRQLAAIYPNVRYLPCILRGPPTGSPVDSSRLAAGPMVGSLDAVLSAAYPSLAGWRVFLCGDPELVTRLRRQVFLAGASRRDIASDPFLIAPPSSRNV